MRKPAQWKTELVKKVAGEIDKSKLAAVVKISGIRNNQLQSIRRTLKGQLQIRVMRGTLLHKAIEKSKKENIKEMESAIDGQIALVLSDHEPNELYDVFETTKIDAPPRGGEIAENDIVIEPMDTGFPPGPMISEFQKVGLQTGVEKGSITIKKETLFVKQGDVISKDKAKILEKLNIKPLRVGLTILGAIKDGVFFDRDVLSISTEKILSDLSSAFAGAKHLALGLQFIVPEILPDLLVKARMNAEALAMGAGIVNEANIEIFIMKAIKEATALSEATTEEDQSSPAEEKPKEEEQQESPQKTDEDVSSGLDALFG